MSLVVEHVDLRTFSKRATVINYYSPILLMAVINNIKINRNFQHRCNYAEQHGQATEVHV